MGGLICYLSPAIRQRDADGALKVVALAWLYVLDTILNSLYTTMFGLGWFILLAQHLNERSPLASNKPPGGSIMNETAGFTDPEHSVSEVEVVATPAPGAMSGQDAVAYGAGDSSAQRRSVPARLHGVRLCHRTPVGCACVPVRHRPFLRAQYPPSARRQRIFCLVQPERRPYHG